MLNFSSGHLDAATRCGEKNMVYDGFAISMILLLLSGVVLMCIVATAMPLFMNHRNVGELMPIAKKGAKLSAILAAICIVLELASPGSAARAPNLVITTAVLFLWAIALIYLLKYRDRSFNFGD
jgi:hypothetical protein